MCDCSTSTVTDAAEIAVPGRSFTVTGMSCQPCATRVTTAVRQVPGVGEAMVDLAASRLTVTGDASDAAIHAAVIEAGYQISNA